MEPASAPAKALQGRVAGGTRGAGVTDGDGDRGSLLYDSATTTARSPTGGPWFDDLVRRIDPRSSDAARYR
jgi:hypothetical protein